MSDPPPNTYHRRALSAREQEEEQQEAVLTTHYASQFSISDWQESVSLRNLAAVKRQELADLQQQHSDLEESDSEGERERERIMRKIKVAVNQLVHYEGLARAAENRMALPTARAIYNRAEDALDEDFSDDERDRALPRSKE